MTLTRILGYALIAMALLSAGCGLLGGGSESPPPANTNSSTPSAAASPSARAQTQTPMDFAGAKEHVQEASNKLRKQPGQPGRTSSVITVRVVRQELNAAISKLGNDEPRLEDECSACSEDTKQAAKDALQSLLRVNENIEGSTKDKDDVSKLDEARKRTWVQDLNIATGHLTNAIKASQNAQQDVPANLAANANANQNANTNTQQSGTSGTDGDETGWWGILLWALYGVAGILLLVLVAVAFMFLWKHAWKSVENNISGVVNTHVAAVRNAQPDYEQRLSTLTSTQRDITNRLTELDTEVRSLSRLVRESLANRNERRPLPPINYASQYDDFSANDEPEFPVSAGDYLEKMNRYANVVRPDFQNGILVNDPDGRGELVLIRDSRSSDESRPLFVVPRATQFQTKQDFYTCYQKYYNCDRPAAGNVWIIGPAVVEKVAGGWQLREKGMLEVR